MKITLLQDVHVHDPQYNLWGRAWGGQRAVDMPESPQEGGEITIRSGSHRATATIETVMYVDGEPHVRLSPVGVFDPARLGTAIEEHERLGYKSTGPLRV